MVSCKLLTLLVLIYITGGSLGAEVKSAIVGGKDARVGAWPWMVHLNITFKGNGERRCGGTIVSNEWVLSSTHCCDKSLNIDYHKSFAIIGVRSLGNPANRYVGIDYVVNHSEYAALANGYKNDIAMVRLKKKINYKPGVVEKVNLAGHTPQTSECWIVGWGDIGKNVPLPYPETLQQAQISIVPHGTCKQSYPELTNGMMCASTNGNMGPCKGDYGGPLMCREGRGFVQVGIMSSWGQDGCGLRGRPSLYTQVSHYLKFIDKYLRHSERAPAEV